MRLSTGTRPMMRRTRAYNRSTVRMATIAITNSIGTTTAIAMRCRLKRLGQREHEQHEHEQQFLHRLTGDHDAEIHRRGFRQQQRASQLTEREQCSRLSGLGEKDRVQQRELDAERTVQRPPAHALNDIEAHGEHDHNRDVDEVETLECDADLVRVRVHEQCGDGTQREQPGKVCHPPASAARSHIRVTLIQLVGTGGLRHHASMVCAPGVWSARGSGSVRRCAPRPRECGETDRPGPGVRTEHRAQLERLAARRVQRLTEAGSELAGLICGIGVEHHQPLRFGSELVSATRTSWRIAPPTVRVSPTLPVLPPSTSRNTGRTRSVFEIPASSAGTRPVRAT